jgi:hypothetical protein
LPDNFSCPLYKLVLQSSEQLLFISLVSVQSAGCFGVLIDALIIQANFLVEEMITTNLVTSHFLVLRKGL